MNENWSLRLFPLRSNQCPDVAGPLEVSFSACRLSDDLRMGVGTIKGCGASSRAVQMGSYVFVLIFGRCYLAGFSGEWDKYAAGRVNTFLNVYIELESEKGGK